MELKYLQGKALANLTDSDVTGVIRDILGSPVIINGKVYNHLKEVNEALGGIGKQINKINELIKKVSFLMMSWKKLKELEKYFLIKKIG